VVDARGGTYTTDMSNRTNGSGTLFTDADNRWGNGATSDRASIGVDAQYGTNATWDFYKSTFGRTGIRGDGRGSSNRAHYGRNYNNAFWQDSCFCMTYGDGDGRTYKPFTALDVAGHEMSHGVTASTAALTYSGESGGLNEATSDIFGTLVEFFAKNANDPADYQIGERLTFSGQPLRWMDDPRKDGASASCWSSSVGGLNVHYSSGVANHFFYLLAVGSGQSAYGNSPTCNGSSVAGIGNADAGRIWYRALTTYMTSSSNYKAARGATLQAASDLFGAASAQRAAVDRAWAAVSVTA
jgi:Zn-dependent metalloprotease